MNHEFHSLSFYFEFKIKIIKNKKIKNYQAKIILIYAQIKSELDGNRIKKVFDILRLNTSNLFQGWSKKQLYKLCENMNVLAFFKYIYLQL